MVNTGMYLWLQCILLHAVSVYALPPCEAISRLHECPLAGQTFTFSSVPSGISSLLDMNNVYLPCVSKLRPCTEQNVDFHGIVTMLSWRGTGVCQLFAASILAANA